MVLVEFPGWNPQQSWIHGRVTAREELQIHKQHRAGKTFTQNFIINTALHRTSVSDCPIQKNFVPKWEFPVPGAAAGLWTGSIPTWHNSAASNCPRAAGWDQGMPLKESLLVGKRSSVIPFWWDREAQCWACLVFFAGAGGTMPILNSPMDFAEVNAPPESVEQNCLSNKTAFWSA